ncbi:MAG: hypothetical protein PHS59_00770 [Paludibacter sp.]|nr:hypothetical protein [Paludibacter sp.]
MNKDYSIPKFLQSLCKLMRSSDINIRQLLTRIIHINLFLLLLAVPQFAKANTTFSPTNSDYFNVSLATGNDGYNLIYFRTLTYDFDGWEDRMDNFTLYYSTNNGASYTQILTFKIGNNNAFDTWTPTNSATAGYFSTTAGDINTSTKDLRYANYRWKYPQSLIGQQIRFKISYGWDLNWYHDSKIETVDSYDNLYVTTPNYSPAITSSSFVPKAGNNVEFTYTKSATSSPVNKVSLYSDASCSNLLSSFDVDIAATTATKTFAWTNSFVGASSLYVKYNYVISDLLNTSSPSKNYSSLQTTTNNGYIVPLNMKCLVLI